MEHNCAFQDGHMKFRYRAAAVIIENKNVLMVTSDTSDYYYSIWWRCTFRRKSRRSGVTRSI